MSDSTELSQLNSAAMGDRGDKTEDKKGGGGGGGRGGAPAGPGQVVEEYANETSAHGVKKMITSPRLLSRLVWTLLFLGAVAMIIFQLIRLIEIFRLRPVNVKTKVESKPLTFPAITICNLNTVYLSKVQDEVDLIGSLKAIGKLYNIPLESFTLKDGKEVNYSHIPTKEFGSDFPVWEAKQDVKVWLAILTKDDLIKLSQSKDEFILSCELARETCDRDFVPIKDPDMGICFQWEPKPGKGDPVNSQGPASGMTLLLNVERSEYLPFIATSTGVRVHMHQPRTPVLMREEGISLPPGFESSIGVRPVETVRQPDPYGDCDNSGNYTNRLSCERDCFEAAVESSCDCTRRYNLDVSSDCSSRDYTCIRATEEDFLSGRRVCKCKMPCRSRVFQRDVSMTTWPSWSTLPLVTRRVNERSGLSGRNFNTFEIQENFLQLKIFFSELVEETIEEEPAYQWENLLSDVGGQLGLWLGISIMSLVEVMEFLGFLIASAVSKGRSKKTSPNHLDKVTAF